MLQQVEGSSLGWAVIAQLEETNKHLGYVITPEQKQQAQVRHNDTCPQTRLCSSCNKAIPAARLKAQPGADQCVACLEAAGDVVTTKRYDETSGKDGEDVTPIYFRTPSAHLEKRMKRLSTFTQYTNANMDVDQ